MFDIIRKDEYFTWAAPNIANSSRYLLVPSHYSLKGIQDAWVLSLLEHKRDLKLAEIGGGKSRVLETLSARNECWNIDKFEGVGAGPLEIQELPGVKIVRSYMGDFDSDIPDSYFDVVFSISVIEHVPKDQLEAFFADCYRILKPGGLLIHAIDLYISDEPTSLTETVELYRQALEKQPFVWHDEPAISKDTTFRCDFASNSDLIMTHWNTVAPALQNIRKNHQSVSIKMVGIREGDRALTDRLLQEEPEPSLTESPPSRSDTSASDSTNAETPESIPQSDLASSATASSVEGKESASPSSAEATAPSVTASAIATDYKSPKIQAQKKDWIRALPESLQSDPNWMEAIEFLSQTVKSKEPILVPPQLKKALPKACPYRNASKHPIDRFRWVIIHKGQLQALETSLLRHIVQTFTPVFANTVFVIFSSQVDNNPLALSSPHVQPLVAAVSPQKSFATRAKDKLAKTYRQWRRSDNSHGLTGADHSPGLTGTDRATLIQEAQKARWFHAIDFGDFQSAGRFGVGQRQNITLFPVFEIVKGLQVTDMDCLDMGAACGLVSFGLRALGAKRVVATDIVKFRTLEISNALLDANVEYIPFTRADQVSDRFPEERFDLVVCAGVLYHMFNPMGAIAEARLLLRKGGLFVVETAYDPKRSEPVMELNSESSQPFKEAYTYWNISESAVAGILKLCGFNIIRRVKLKGPSRIAFLAQAVDYSAIQDRTDLAKRMHELGFGEQKYLAGRYPNSTSDIQFDSTLPDAVIDIKTYQSQFPHHIDFPEGGVGSTLYNPKQGDF